MRFVIIILLKFLKEIEIEEMKKEKIPSISLHTDFVINIQVFHSRNDVKLSILTKNEDKTLKFCFHPFYEYF